MATRLHSAFLYGLILAVFGVWIPLQKATDIFDPLLFVPFSCLSWVFVAPVIPESLARYGKLPSRLWMWGRLATAVLFAWTANLVVLGTALYTVNRMVDGTRFYAPRMPLLVTAPLLGLAGSILLAGAGAWMCLNQWTPNWTRLVLRLILMLLLFGYAISVKLFPDLLLLRLKPGALGIAAGVLGSAGLLFCLAVSGSIERLSRSPAAGSSPGTVGADQFPR